MRDTKAGEEEIAERNKFLNSATPEEITALKTKDKAKYERWGLAPSADVMDFVNKNPELRGILIDENGNYRSKLYQTMFVNKYQIGEEKTAYQQGKLFDQKLIEEQKAYAPYTQAESPFSSYQPSPVQDVAGATTEQPVEQPTEQAFSLPSATHVKVPNVAGLTSGKYTNITKPGLNPNNPEAVYGVPTSTNTNQSVTDSLKKAGEAAGNLGTQRQQYKEFVGPQQPTFTPPSGFEQISNPSQIGQFTNVTDPGLNPNKPKALYGKRRI